MENALLEKAQMLYMRAQGVEEQLQMIREQIIQFNEFQENLENFSKNKDNRMLASFGKGVFVSTELKDRELWVDVGAGVIVKKNVSETKEIIVGQIKKLNEMREPLEDELADLSEELSNLSSEIQSKSI